MMLRLEDAQNHWPIAIIPPALFTTTLYDPTIYRPHWTETDKQTITTIQRKLDAGEPVTYTDTRTLGIAVRTLSDAEGVAEGAREWFRHRAALEDDYLNSADPEDLWHDDAQHNYAAALHSGNAAVHSDHEVTATIPAQFDQGASACTALDYGGQWLPTTATIRDIDTHTAAITW